MGNDLTRIAPTQLYPIEYYVQDLSMCKYEKTLRITRFMKVVRAIHEEGYLVVKIFVIQDINYLPLEYLIELERISRELKANAPNCQPYELIERRNRAAYVIRQYIKYNLHDRMMSRPFLTIIEKRIIVYQILLALQQCHSKRICHGDLKMQNVLLTSWNWTVVADFAPFKPVYLPNDDPSLFYYFFDLADLNTCYVAPERFLPSSVYKNEQNIVNPNINSQIFNRHDESDDESAFSPVLTTEMDIFSAGCIIAEIFLNGTPLFKFKNHLEFQKDEWSPNDLISTIVCPDIRQLILRMISKNPTNRPSAEECTFEYKNLIFPSFFDKFFLHFEAFASIPNLSPERKIEKITDAVDFLQRDGHFNQFKNDNLNESPAILILSIITSNLEICKYVSTKLKSLNIINRILIWLPDHIILDRIIPHVILFTHNQASCIKIYALKIIVESFKVIRKLDKSNKHIFVRYIVKKLIHLEQDKSKCVHLYFVKSIVLLCQEAKRLLDNLFYEKCQLTQVNQLDNQNGNLLDLNKYLSVQDLKHYNEELTTLRKSFNQLFQSFFNENDIQIRSLLLEYSLEICQFLGYEMAVDTVLSHVMTYLNLNNTGTLKELFFKNIPKICAYFGWHYVSCIDAMFFDGLYDNSEMVIYFALECLRDLSDSGILSCSVIMRISQSVACHLFHPNDWIKFGAVQCFFSFSKILNPGNSYHYLIQKIAPFINIDIFRIKSIEQLYFILSEPLPKMVYDYLINNDSVIQQIEDKSESDKIIYKDVDLSIFKDKILFMKQTLFKAANGIQMNLKYSMSISLESKCFNNKNFNLLEDKLDVTYRMADLSKHAHSLCLPKGYIKYNVKITDAIEADWISMFNTPQNFNHLDSKDSETATTVSRQSHFFSSLTDMNLDYEKNKKIVSKDIDTIRKIIDEKGVQFINLKNEMYQNKLDLDKSIDTIHTKVWNPKGICICHIHEHSNSVNRIVYSNSNKLLASCSNDGTAKLWEIVSDYGPKSSSCATFRRSPPKHQKTFSISSNVTSNESVSLVRANSIDFLSYFGGVVVLFDNQYLQIFNLDRDNDCATDYNFSRIFGRVLGIKTYITGMSSTVACSTSQSNIHGWDIRQNNIVWTANMDPSHGLITTFDIDKRGTWMSVGTSNGLIHSWDLRYITSLDYYNPKCKIESPVYNLQIQDPSWLIYSQLGNKDFTFYDVKSNVTLLNVNLCDYPAKSKKAKENLTVTKYQYIPGSISEEKPFGHILCTATDRRIRYMDLANPLKCKVVVKNSDDEKSKSKFFYDLINNGDSPTMNEFVLNSKENHTVPEYPNSFGSISSSHHDSITDIVIIENDFTENIFATSGRDGVIIFWV
ncbi:PI3-kinase subunit [Intoshia linei]|uniref:non-specific serine/threonine protein kinase n=1 Tax=Intoshia linei TaxID=1819745 RepID=A0A177B828_9BILA|nr:PI3-kinase subunit [Intoshia linei]